MNINKIIIIIFIIFSWKSFSAACPTPQGTCTLLGCGTTCSYYTCASASLPNISIDKIPFNIATATTIPPGACDIVSLPIITLIPQSYSGGLLKKIPDTITINAAYKICVSHSIAAAACPPPLLPVP